MSEKRKWTPMTIEADRTKPINLVKHGNSFCLTDTRGKTERRTSPPRFIRSGTNRRSKKSPSTVYRNDIKSGQAANKKEESGDASGGPKHRRNEKKAMKFQSTAHKRGQASRRGSITARGGNRNLQRATKGKNAA